MSSSDRVVIAGAGPVGLTAALLLIRRGVTVTLFEREPALPQDLRASTFHPPTLDLLDEVGIAAPLIAAGLKCPSWQIRMHESGERALFDLGLLAADTPHPYRLQCEQAKLTGLLLDRIEQLAPGTVRFGAAVERVGQDGHRVWAETAGERLEARFLIAADGARSRVRKDLAMKFEGATYPETTILATTDLPFEAHLEGLSNVNYVWQASGTYSLLRLPDRWRVSLYPPTDRSLDEALDARNIRARLSEIAPAATGFAIGEARAYRVHMRIVDHYRRGRIFLAGDAAHVNSPSGGMGMNGGIHDAFELVATLLDGWAADDERLLDRYDRRRRAVAADDIIGQADRNRARMQERDTAKRRALLSGLQAIVADPRAARSYLLRSSMIDGLRRAAAIA